MKGNGATNGSMSGLSAAVPSNLWNGWLPGEQRKTLGSLIDTFGKSFAVTFVVLMAVPALALPQAASPTWWN
jgi:hypothetical protein